MGQPGTSRRERPARGRSCHLLVAATRSRSPSPFTSPLASAWTTSVSGYSVIGWNWHPPIPRRTSTLLSIPVAKSGCPSWLKSPITIDCLGDWLNCEAVLGVTTWQSISSPNVPFPWFKHTLRVRNRLTRSGKPSPFQSRTTVTSPMHLGLLVPTWKSPLTSARNTVGPLDPLDGSFVSQTRSSLPSPLRSATRRLRAFRDINISSQRELTVGVAQPELQEKAHDVQILKSVSVGIPSQDRRR